MMADQWYFTEQGQRKGPVSEEELRELASTGHLKTTDKVWKKGMASWTRASEVDGLLPLPDPDAPPPLDSEDSEPPPLEETTPAVSEWYYVQGGQRNGPISEPQLSQLASSGQIRPTDLVWKNGMAKWVPMHQALSSPSALTGQVEKSALQKCYLGFQITLIAIFALGALTLGFSYYYGLFLVAIGFAICNFIAGMNNRLGTSPWDLVIMILAAVSIIPWLGWITQIIALAFSILALVKYLKLRPQAGNQATGQDTPSDVATLPPRKSHAALIWAGVAVFVVVVVAALFVWSNMDKRSPFQRMTGDVESFSRGWKSLDSLK